MKNTHSLILTAKSIFEHLMSKNVQRIFIFGNLILKSSIQFVVLIEWQQKQSKSNQLHLTFYLIDYITFCMNCTFNALLIMNFFKKYRF